MSKGARGPSCPYCSAPAKLVTGEAVYPHREQYARDLFWCCAPCRAYVGVHRGTTKPLGRLANFELRREKIAAHRAFDQLWQSGRMERSEAYRSLANMLGIPAAACHIGMFDAAQCRLVVQVCAELLSSTEAPAT